jgi:hypothetical protein
MMKKGLRSLLRSFLRDERGVVNLTTVFDGTDTFISDVAFTATKDKTATIAHGIGATPQDVQMSPLQPEPFYVGRAAITTINTTNVIVTKLSTAASSNAAAAIRVIIKRPHTLGR